MLIGIGLYETQCNKYTIWDLPNKTKFPVSAYGFPGDGDLNKTQLAPIFGASAG
jgi:hypothetical protein